MLTNALLYAGLLPLAVSAAIAFIMRQFRYPPQIAWSVATTVGFLIAQFALRSQSGLDVSLHTFIQPHEALDWLPHIVLLALGVGIVMHLAPAHRPSLIALGAALCLAAPARLLSGNLAQHWSIPGKFAVLISLAAALGIVWALMASTGDKRPATLSAILQILVAVGTAIAVTLSGALTYGLACGALAAAITGSTLALLGATGSASASRRPADPGTAAASGILTFTLGSLIILSHFYAELSTINAGLLFLSLTATAAPLPALVRRGPAWQQTSVRLICCLIPLAMAVGSVLI
jgi:hypothetical protein